MSRTDFNTLQQTSNEISIVTADAKQTGQEHLELSRLLKNNTSADKAHLYFLDSFSRQSLPNIASSSQYWLPTVQSVDCTPIPQAIRSLYSQVECEMFMGLFPEINRAWITIDNKLFLWNYYQGDQFYMYSGLDQLIVSVGLARPLPGVFSVDVQYLLVISTPVEIVILELWFLGDDPATGPIELRPTEFNIASDDVPMRCIAGTSNGRIFMGGHDGSLYELIYERASMLHSLGLKRQCRKVELSGSIGKWLVPGFLRSHFAATEPIKQLEVDHERGYLYTLSGDSTLSFYKFDDCDGIHLCKSGKISSMLKIFLDKQHRTHWIGLSSQDLSAANAIKIIKLQTVTKYESDNVTLVCLTQRGVRIYLKTDPHGGITFEHVRGPPNEEEIQKYLRGDKSTQSSTSLLAQRNTNQTKSEDVGIRPGKETGEIVTNAFYANGVTILGTSSSHSTLMEDQLCAFSSDLGMRRISQDSDAIFKDIPCLKWQQVDFHEIVDSDILGSGPSLRQNTFEGVDRYTNVGLPVGRVWEISEVIVDPAVSFEEEAIYSHMLHAPSPMPTVVSNQIESNSNNKRLAPDSVQNTRLSINQPQSEVVGLTEISRQHVLPRRYFIVLTAHGVWKLVKNQPINQLYSLFESFAPDQDIKEFFRQYGLDESCAMCLNIACTASDSMDYDASSTRSKTIADRAILWLTRFGYGVSDLSSGMQTEVQLPCYADKLVNNTSNSSTLSAAMINPVGVSGGPSGIIHSGCFNGLELYMSRLFRPFWDWTVVIQESSNNSDISIRCRWTSNQIGILVAPLLRLKRFLETNQPFANAIKEYRSGMTIPVPSTRGVSNPLTPWKNGRVGLPQRANPMTIENQKIAQHFKLIDRTIQTLMLFDILQNGGTSFSKLVQDLEADIANTLCSGFTWADFTTTVTGQVLASALVKNLVESGSQDDVSSKLEADCPSFFSQGDSLQIAAFEAMTTAERLQGDRADILKYAMEMFRQGFENSAKHARSQMEVTQSVVKVLRDACTKVEKLGHASDSLSLVLACARCFASDVESLPLIMNSSSSQADRQTQNELRIRHECYNIAIEILSGFIKSNSSPNSEVQRMIDVAIASRDALWHYLFYGWLLKEGFAIILLNVKSSYIVNFLSDPIANDPMKSNVTVFYNNMILHTDVHMTLLAEWYTNSKDYARAASVMQKLATMNVMEETESENNISLKKNPVLSQRIVYLSKAIHNAKTCGANSSIDSSQLRDELDVARLQEQVKHGLEEQARSFNEHETARRPGVSKRQEVQWLSKALKTLDTTLLSPSELYNEYAYPSGLWKACIDIMYVCDHDDESELEILYANIFGDSIANCPHDLMRIRMAMETKLKELGKEYVNKRNVFPCNYIIQGLEDLFTFYVFENEQYKWSPWVIDTLINLRVSFHRVFKGYEAYAQKIQSAAIPLGSKFARPGTEDDSAHYDNLSKVIVTNAIIHIITIWNKQKNSGDLDFNECSKLAIEHLEALIDQIPTTGGSASANSRDELKTKVERLKMDLSHDNNY